jgi:hypothetical protein
MEQFYDDESGYLRWKNAHSSGYVLNCYKATSRSGGPYMLHRAACHTLENKNLTTGQYYKVCSLDRADLIGWADRQQAENGYDAVKRCTKCNP